MASVKVGLLPLVVVLVAGLISPAPAQLTGTLAFDVSIDSSYFDDCDPGIPCLAVFCGLFAGTLTMDYVGFDGVFDNYDVTAVDWLLHRGSCPANPTLPADPVVGTGTFQIDRAPVPSQRMILDLTRPNGPPITINSGFVTTSTPFPSFLDFEMVSHPTSETFTLVADLTSPEFVRGDANTDGSFNLADAITVLGSLFGSSPNSPSCDDAHDANDDGQRNLADAVFVLTTLFSLGAPNPPAPFPTCGPDPTPDALTCTSFGACP